ncbi:hypothetical protein [Hymenobacter sediminicola]|uniref:DUF3137 domain-containing protein n=1 Tax=Hymenobacter sediminicola TaxID=2761579 RepID=A0A7G7W5N8_9BACT|nr:hypothetical protein [Hymenobacter sediminicola]QNH61681.1 hypothetical protein H4317_16200 [Hymenobacter sediminicola]
MTTLRSFSADSETALWHQVATDMAQQPDLLEYSAELQQNGFRIRFELDIDLGGGFEGGYELTSFTATVPGQQALNFALHEQDWVHELGKLLGLTDVELGDTELDDAFIITTNNPDELRTLLLSDPAVRHTLLKYQELRLELTPASHAPDAEVLLTFTKEQALTDPGQLQEIYHLLYLLLQQLQVMAN